MAHYKAERNAKLLEMEWYYNFTELGELFEISRERVRQIVREHGITHQGNHEDSMTRRILRSNLLGTMTDREVAELFNVPTFRVAGIRRRHKIPGHVKKIGCAKCIEKPYAKGLCRNCYAINLRRTKKISSTS